MSNFHLNTAQNFAPQRGEHQAFFDMMTNSVLQPDAERKNAGNLISDLLLKHQEREGVDPFLLLRECLDIQTLAQHKGIVDVNDYRLTGYQNLSAGFNTAPSDGNLTGVVKNKDLFLRAQQKVRAGKQTDWFSKLYDNESQKKPVKNGLTKEDEIQIGLDMIPMFQAKEEELTIQFEKIKNVRQELEAFKEEHNITLRYVQPKITTSFMNRKVSQCGSYGKDYIQSNKQKFTQKPTSNSRCRVDEPRDSSCESQPTTFNKDSTQINEKSEINLKTKVLEKIEEKKTECLAPDLKSSQLVTLGARQMTQGVFSIKNNTVSANMKTFIAQRQQRVMDKIAKLTPLNDEKENTMKSSRIVSQSYKPPGQSNLQTNQASIIISPRLNQNIVNETTAAYNDSTGEGKQKSKDEVRFNSTGNSIKRVQLNTENITMPDLLSSGKLIRNNKMDSTKSIPNKQKIQKLEECRTLLTEQEKLHLQLVQQQARSGVSSAAATNQSQQRGNKDLIDPAQMKNNSFFMSQTMNQINAKLNKICSNVENYKKIEVHHQIQIDNSTKDAYNPLASVQIPESQQFNSTRSKRRRRRNRGQFATNQVQASNSMVTQELRKDILDKEGDGVQSGGTSPQNARKQQVTQKNDFRRGLPKIRRSVEYILSNKSDKLIYTGECHHESNVVPYQQTPRVLIPSTKNSQRSRRKKTADPAELTRVDHDKILLQIEREVNKIEANQNKRKKSSKQEKQGWRYAYDVYCREIINNNQVSDRLKTAPQPTETITLNAASKISSGMFNSQIQKNTKVQKQVSCQNSINDQQSSKVNRVYNKSTLDEKKTELTKICTIDSANEQSDSHRLRVVKTAGNVPTSRKKLKQIIEEKRQKVQKDQKDNKLSFSVLITGEQTLTQKATVEVQKYQIVDQIKDDPVPVNKPAEFVRTEESVKQSDRYQQGNHDSITAFRGQSCDNIMQQTLLASIDINKNTQLYQNDEN